MSVEFRHHDSLRLFVEIARHRSFSDAAGALNMTKGAVSYQVKTLEAELGFALFQRNARGVEITAAGQKLLAACQSHYEDIEAGVLALKGVSSRTLTVGVSTYFAARWLSPRLMSFMQEHPDIQLRLQPMIRLFDLEAQGVDIAIRWGSGQWEDGEITPFMPCPAYPVGNAAALEQVERQGIAQAVASMTLLRDHDDSNAWSDWQQAAGLPQQARRDALIIPDPNVRVQAVIDGQGIALMDALIARELEEAKLFRLSDHALTDYGYFLVRPRQSSLQTGVKAFADWLQSQ
ncbi:LysR family transcriptional regulator (plasmid) [Leisingera sp. M527]|uniref:LysR substrate-binding domain-containing protein n=2 Tax=Leisingera TaxID=191028 RepID=UPI0021A7282B|nr:MULTISPECIES: LysR substrate-binding domain-containing protein [unclassified Leisingera]UWQ35762.1 LysR family transcriptional regulator [Leisingera sp. M527]UWQ77520.1 LysR family transcriptional regulator [Leisingera sp. M658]